MKRSPFIVSLDSNTLVWGIRKKGLPDKVRRARNLFAYLEEEEARIVIPSIVVTEFVTPLKTTKEREAVIAEMNKRFVIAPFDARAAAVAADLWHYGKKAREKKHQMKQIGARMCLRADTLIIATVHAQGVQVFYTDDDNCYDMARRIIADVRRLPDIGPHLWADRIDEDKETTTAQQNEDGQRQTEE
jgi:predicted nucleic acid-binding protein